MRPRRAIAAMVTAGLLSLAGGAASAEPTVWGRARNPDDAARRALIAEAQALELKYHLYRSGRRDHLLDRQAIQTLAEMYLVRALELFDLAGARRSRDPFVRLEVAEVLGLLGKHAEAVTVLESVVRADPPPVIAARAWASLAVDYAHLSRVDEEIDAYTRALAVQPLAPERARILANRAEAYMLLGDITAAISGYRSALALMSVDLFLSARGSGVTTLWGLAVALDRSGDLDGGLDAVRVARSYDREDKQLSGPGWFYVPEYDRHWYAALGHWAVARHGDLGSVRVNAYALTITELDDFITRAARDDKWLPLARARRKQCERERAAFLRREAARPAGERQPPSR